MHTFEALADSTRTEIVEVLAARPQTVNEIVALFPISQPAISRHLKVLREAGLVTVRPEGKTRVYQLDPAPLRELDRWLDRYRHFWASKLDALEAFMDEEPE